VSYTKKILLITILLCSKQILSIDKKTLIEHVKNSIQKAHNYESKLNEPILAIEGYTGKKVKHFLNNLCSLEESNYLEIGVFKGATLIAALYGNTQSLSSATAIDNWSEFGGPKKTFLENTNLYLPRNSFWFFDNDCFTQDKSIFRHPINIYFYDGNHSFEAQYQAFAYFNNIFDNVFIAVVDDWAWENVQKGTRQAFADLNYKILFETEIFTFNNIDPLTWWNGLYVAVLEK
jgi:hypothetical protein